MITYEIRECALGITGRRTYRGRLPVCTSKVKLWINRSPKAQRLDGSVFSERESCWLGFSLLQIPFHMVASISAPPVYTAAACTSRPAASQYFRSSRWRFSANTTKKWGNPASHRQNRRATGSFTKATLLEYIQGKQQISAAPSGRTRHRFCAEEQIPQVNNSWKHYCAAAALFWFSISASECLDVICENGSNVMQSAPEIIPAAGMSDTSTCLMGGRGTWQTKETACRRTVSGSAMFSPTDWSVPNFTD